MTRIFWKGFLRVFLVIAGMVILIHGVIFWALPKSYLEEKTWEISRTADEVTKNLKGKNIAYIEQVLDFYSRTGEIKAFLKASSQQNEIKISELLAVNPNSENNSVIIDEREVELADGGKVNVQFVSTADLEKDAMNFNLKFLPWTLIGSILIAFLVAGIYAKLETLRMKQLNFEFLRGASHELKTPLTSLKIVLENMQFKVGKYKDRDFYLEKCSEMVDELNEGISELLLMSKMDSFEKCEWIEIREALEEVLSKNRVMIMQKNLQIKKTVGDEKIWLNRTAFMIILGNLVGNAVRYTEVGGRISIAVEENELVIKNSSADEILREKAKGSGLGLYIVRNLLKKYGLKYEIREGKKSFSFWINLKSVKKRNKTLA